jgi:hypothetical protein
LNIELALPRRIKTRHRPSPARAANSGLSHVSESR